MSVKTHGIKIGYRTTPGSGAFTLLAGIVDVETPQAEFDDIETTTIEDGVAEVNTYEAGNEEPGEMSLTLRFAAAQAAAIEAIKGLTKEFKVTYRNGSHRTFTGYVKTFGEKSEVKGLVNQPCVIKVSGASALAASSSSSGA